LLGGNTLLVRQEGVKKLIAEYRPPGKVGLFLDGSETALRVPCRDWSSSARRVMTAIHSITCSLSSAARPR
jgi:hypothetical protein